MHSFQKKGQEGVKNRGKLSSDDPISIQNKLKNKNSHRPLADTREVKGEKVINHIRQKQLNLIDVLLGVQHQISKKEEVDFLLLMKAKETYLANCIEGNLRQILKITPLSSSSQIIPPEKSEDKKREKERKKAWFKEQQAEAYDLMEKNKKQAELQQNMELLKQQPPLNEIHKPQLVELTEPPKRPCGRPPKSTVKKLVKKQ